MKQTKLNWLSLATSLFLVVLIFLFFQPKFRKIEKIPTPPPVGSNLITPGPEAIVSSDVNYFNSAVGFYAEPAQTGTYPGVIMVHEWWGLNDNIKTMAKNLASMGYRVFAVDLYHGKIGQNMQEAQNLVSSLKPEESLANMRAAKKYLLDQGASKIASLGWCFGGGQSLQFSLSEKDLSATVIYYGQLSTDSAKLKSLKWPVLGIFGDQDRSIPVSTVRAFEAALNRNKIPNEIYIYKGVGHAFANPTGPSYAETETKDAWEKTLSFLAKHLQ